MNPIPQGYKQTEIGVIPEDWEVKTFNKVTDSITCGIAATPKYVSEQVGRPFLSAQNVKPGRLSYSGHKYISQKLFDQITKHTKPEKGDILYTRVGAGIGEAAIIPDDYEFSIYVSLTLIKISQSYLNSDFVVHLLNSDPYRFLAKNGQFAGGGVQNLNVSVVKNYPIPLPTLKEQSAIATALSDVDALITGLESLIAKKQAIKTATMQQLLTGKTRLPQFAHHPDGTPKGTQQTELGEIPEDWRILVVASLGIVVTGGTPPTTVSEYWNGDIPWITPTDISSRKDISVSERQISVKGLRTIRILPANTVLVTCIASIGKNAVLRSEGACNQQINAVIPNKNVNVDFLFYSIEQSSERLRSSAGITATLIVSKALFESFQLIFPDTLEEQTAIAQILSDMDEEIQTLQTRLSKTQQIKQGMMQQLLTGKVRLVKPLHGESQHG